MGIVISVGKKPEEIWIAQNWVYRWMVGLVEENYPSEPDILEELRMAEHINGISLELLAKEDIQLSKKISKTVRQVSQGIASGHYTVPGTDEYHQLISEDSMKGLFAELVKILDVTDTW